MDEGHAPQGQAVEGGHRSPFERLLQRGEDGGEYWSARDLAGILGYDTNYRNFKRAIEKAEIACVNSGHAVEDHFADARKMVTIGSGARRSVEDMHLSRYACYLTVQNADPNKPNVSLGQTYFAVQTRRQEQTDELAGLTDDQKRLYLRGQVADHNRQLAEAAGQAGVVQGPDFAVFVDHGYMGLYAGLRARDIHARKGLPRKEHILDHMGATELAANLFRATQTDEKLRRDNIQGKHNANRTHYEVGQAVRKTIEDLGGAMPEDLPTPAESIKRVKEKERTRVARQIQPPLFPEAEE